jgi:hypothetical protein
VTLGARGQGALTGVLGLVARPELLDSFRSAEDLLAATGEAVALRPVYRDGDLAVDRP